MGGNIFKGLGDYRTLTEVYTSALEWKDRIGFPAAKKVIAESRKGRELWALGLGDPEKPAVMYAGGIHGMEFIGVEQVLALMDWFAEPEHGEKVEAILRGASVWFIPTCNPDGYARTVNQLQRFKVSFSRCNAGSVDLNRNWPVAWDRKSWNPLSSSTHKISPYYHGPQPLSEPETMGLSEFALSHPIKASICFHSFGNFLGYPPCYTAQPCDDTELMNGIAKQIAARQKKPYRVNQEFFYLPTSGDFDDWLYFEAGVLPFLMEVGPMQLSLRRPITIVNPFALANPPNVKEILDNNTGAVVYLAEWVAGLGSDPGPV